MNDILLDESFDLKFKDGDFATGQSDVQNQELILLFQKGSLKGSPLVGVGIQDYVNASDITNMLREVRNQFDKDQMVTTALSWNDDLQTLDYEATYKS